MDFATQRMLINYQSALDTSNIELSRQQTIKNPNALQQLMLQKQQLQVEINTKVLDDFKKKKNIQ